MKVDRPRLWQRFRVWRRRDASRWPAALSDLAPLDLRIVGRMLWHTALVGLCAGFIGAAFFWALEGVTYLVLEQATGYQPLRAHGEEMALFGHGTRTTFWPWLLVFMPAIGGLLCGLIARWVPDVRGGGADTTIASFHEGGGILKRRLIWAKPLASLATLGTGGAGGREGPTMMIGGAIGSGIGRLLNLGSRERRILLVAGIAAGVSAVFRTPLGAALLAVEILYRDDFESDALVPAILASVIAYSVVISLFGESILLAHAPRYPFTPSHLPLYGLMAVVIAIVAHIALGAFVGARKLFVRVPGPEWLRPAWGGLLLGVIVTPVIMLAGDWTGTPGQGLGILGGGYGAVQTAITGAPWLAGGWTAVGILVLLAFGKMLASAITIGSGGSAGDFAPSLAIGGLIGGAFGRAAQLTIDPSIDPGAFALVGMGAFYGGIAHVPLSALVLVCELAGSYDLLVPLMLALAIALVAMRKRTLYTAQVATQRDSAAHKEEPLVSALESTKVADVMQKVPRYASFEVDTSANEMLRSLATEGWQDTFPVRASDGLLIGLVTADALRHIASDPTSAESKTAAELMQAPVLLRPEDNLRTAGERLMRHGLRELPVVDDEGQIVGFLDEEDITKRYLGVLTQVAGPRLTQTQIRVIPPGLREIGTGPRAQLGPGGERPPRPEPTIPPVVERAPSRPLKKR